MPIDLLPLHPLFVAEADGFPLDRALNDSERQELEDALDSFAVLVFRDQKLSPKAQMDFTRSLGSIDMGLLKVLRGHATSENAGLIAISNVDSDDSLIERSDARMMALYANQLWHSDSSFKKPSAKYSLLFAMEVPADEGDTEFADMRAAYEGLSYSRRAELQGLEAEHSAFFSRMQLGDLQYKPDDLEKYPSVWWPLVRDHPGSGRSSLFIGAHAMGVTGRTTPEGRLLLSELLEHATQKEYVYQHKWRKGDFVIWDNRSVLHRGRSYDLSHRRELRRSTVEDTEV